MRKKKAAILFFTAILACGLLAVVSGYREQTCAAEKKIKKGVRIGSVDVGGMTRQEACDALEALETEMVNTTFELKSDQGSVGLSATEMGVDIDEDASVDQAFFTAEGGSLIDRFKQEKKLETEGCSLKPVIFLDRQKTAEKIDENRSLLGTEAEDNRIVRENGAFTFIEGKKGVEVDVEKSVYAIEDALADWSKEKGNSVEVVTKTQEPRGSRKELEQIQDVLGEYSTDYSSSSGQRAQNVQNGVSKINRTILYPGEEFSVYETVSPFSKENGYELAGSYANGTTVESFGGGICQVSTTLYNAVIRAELEVIQRYNHSMAVAYVKPSEDAAIAGTYKDFRFKNSLNTPIYIQGYCEGGRVYFNIYGKETRPDNREVSFESEVIRTIDPEVKVEYTDAHDAGYVETTQGSHTGYEAQLWKIVKVDGQEESREVFNRSTYDASPTVITVGTRGASSEQLAAMKAAGSSQSASAIRAAIAGAPGEDKEEKNEEEETKEKEEEPKENEEEETKGKEQETKEQKTDNGEEEQKSSDEKKNADGAEEKKEKGTSDDGGNADEQENADGDESGEDEP